MPRKTKNYKHGNRNNHKNYHKTKNNKLKQKKISSQQQVNSKRKNLKFIKRSKEAEEAQRRQKLIEDKYKKLSDQREDEYSEDENEIELNPYDQLISCFQSKDETKSNVIDSSSEENDSEDGEDVDQEDQDMEEEDEIEDDIEEEINENNEETDNDEKSDVEIGKDVSMENKDADEVNKHDELIIEEELDEDTERIEKSKGISNNDVFSRHLEYDLAPEHVDNLLSQQPNLKKVHLKWSLIGNIFVEIPAKSNHPATNDNEQDTRHKRREFTLLEDESVYAVEGEPPVLINHENFKYDEHCIKSQIGTNILTANSSNLIANSRFMLTPLQTELFSIINNYQDLFYPQRTLDNAEEIRLVYCLHALNHMLKTRTKILHHNAKLSAATNSKKSMTIIPDNFRDQGLVRPKILIILPFRESAFRVVNILALLFFGDNAEKMKTTGGVINYKRFEEEYTGNTIRFPKRNPKPEDYEKIFAGNTDDTFRIGISFTKKCIKLYTEFYSSDILIASPLGLRMIVGAPGDAERDYDFLSSIELLILDQAELFFAQNWDHLLHVLDHLHLQTRSVRNTDFSRVRSWCLDGLSKFYRQTLLLTSHELPEFRSLFNNKCCNYRGKIRIANPTINGAIKNVVVQIPQIFHKIKVTSIESSFDIRFKYFIDQILPQFKSPSMAHCMIYVPSYFDYVRLRNYFKSETMNFVQICEYTKDGKIARARDMFYHSGAHFLLYSERAHFFRRTRIKGIRHLIMYQPPYWPNFYSEIINLMQEGNQNSNDGLDTSMSITILYTKYDLLQLSSIISTESASKIFKSDKTTHMFMSGE